MLEKHTYAIGIDVGGSSLKCGVVSNDGTVVHHFLQPLDAAKTEQDVIDIIVNAIHHCAELADGAILGVGIGFPGITDNNIIIGGADNLPGFENLALGDILEAATKYKVCIDNDANMMGLGELAFGAGRGCSDIVFLTVGTGIGGAIVLNGKLYGGYKNRGSELGHIIIQHNGAACTCGARGCFEAYASVTALVNYYQSLDNGQSLVVNGQSIVVGYFQNEAMAVAAMQQHFDYMAAGIASFINVFSPQKVVVGGGISEAGGFYINEIEERVRRIAMRDAMRHTALTAATLGNTAGLLGCAAKVFELL